MFLILLFSVTGCTVDYTIDINEEKKINEIISLDYAGINFNTNDLNNIIDTYKTSDLYKKYYVVNTGDTSYKGNYIYNGMEDFKSNSNFSKSIEYQITDNYLTIKFLCNLSEYFLPDEDAAVSLIKNLNLNIKSPFKVVESNGKKIKNNVYTWNFNEEDYEKEILIKYDTNSTLSNAKYIIIAISGIIVTSIFGVIYLINKTKQVNRI